MGYAEKTVVPVERSRAEIEQLLARYGADQFISGWDDAKGMAMIRFRASGWMVMFLLPIPSQNDKRFTHQPPRSNSVSGVWTERSKKNALMAWEQETRRVWRALALVIKAKLESVDSGITTFQEEFLAHIVLPDGSTVGQWASPQLERAYSSGEMPKDLLGLPAPK